MYLMVLRNSIFAIQSFRPLLQQLRKKRIDDVAQRRHPASMVSIVVNASGIF
jgi:hypothetical protein